MESELLRRIDKTLSGTIYEKLHTLVRDMRDGMEQISSTVAGQAKMSTASQERSLSNQQQIERRVAEIGEQVAARCDRLGAEIAKGTETLCASIETLAEMTTDIGARIENIERSLQRMRSTDALDVVNA